MSRVSFDQCIARSLCGVLMFSVCEAVQFSFDHALTFVVVLLVVRGTHSISCTMEVPTEIEEEIKGGILFKREGGLGVKWREKWFVLYGRSLFWFKNLKVKFEPLFDKPHITFS